MFSAMLRNHPVLLCLVLFVPLFLAYFLAARFLDRGALHAIRVGMTCEEVEVKLKGYCVATSISGEMGHTGVFSLYGDDTVELEASFSFRDGMITEVTVTDHSLMCRFKRLLGIR